MHKTFKLKLLFLVLLLINLTNFSNQIIHSQELWTTEFEKPNPNLYSIQDKFYLYWTGKDSTKKGIGWKQFKRFEDFWIPRVYPTGNFPNQALISQEFEKLNILRSNNRLTNEKLNKSNKIQSINKWNFIGPSTSSGGYNGLARVNVVRINPTDTNIIWAGTSSGGLWKSTNNGDTWTTNTDKLDIMPTLGINDILIDPRNTNTMYIATGDHIGVTYSVGVLKSTNGGETWNTTGLSFNRINTRIIYHLELASNNSNIIYATTNSGIYKSEDAGVNWSVIKSGSHRMIKINKNNNNILYAVNQNSFFRSTNAGTSWTQISTGLPSTDVGRIAMDVAPSDNNVIYLLISNNSNFYRGVYKSIDGGLNWTTQSTTPNILGYERNGSGTSGQGWYDLCIAVNPTEPENIIIGGINLWQSTNSGVNWTNRTMWWDGNFGVPTVHADQHFIGYLNPNSTTIYVGNDGAVYRSRNNGLNWSWIGNGIEGTQFYKLGVSANDPSMVIAGTQDNGTKLKKSTSWSVVMGGDGMECLIKPSNNDIMYGSIYYGAIEKSTNGGNNFRKINDANNDGNYDEINETGGWVTPYLLDPNQSNHIYIGMVNVWKSTNEGVNFTRISNFGGTSKLTILEIAPSNSNFMIASNGNNFRFTTDGGTTWGTKTKPGNNFITSYKFHPTNHNIIYATFSGYSSTEKVLTSTNFGDTWTNITGDLINVPVNSSTIYINGNNEKLLIASDLGVFSQNKGSSQWLDMNDGLPNVIVRELEIQKSDTLLFASTYGRGIWTYSLKQDIVLEQTSLVYPPKDSTNIMIKNSFFSWRKVLNADEYQIQISDDLGFLVIETDLIVTDTNAMINLNKNFKDYHWRVRAKKGNIFGEWSDVFKFRSMIATPSIIEPINNSKNIIDFDKTRWNLINNASAYQINLSKSETFDKLIKNQEISSISFNLDSLERFTQYYFRVRAKSIDGFGLWSNFISFTTIFDKPKLILPTNNNKKVDTNANFTWGRVLGANSYRLIIFENRNNQWTSILSQIINNNSTLNYNYQLEKEKDYKWIVKAIDGTFENISDTFNFRTKVGNPIPKFPIANKIISNSNVSFQIEDNYSDSNKKYEIEINDKISNMIVKTFVSNTLNFKLDLQEEIKELDIINIDEVCLEWRVRTIIPNHQDTSDWSNFESFCYKTPQLFLNSPSNNSKNITKPEFSFNELSDFKDYTLYLYENEIKTENEVKILIDSTYLINNQYIVKIKDYEVNPCNKYYWRVATYLENDTIYSEYWSYNSINSNVENIQPNSKITRKNNDFNFSWNNQTIFDEYEIILSLDNFETIYKTIKTKENNFILKDVDLIDLTLSWKIRGLVIEQNKIYTCEWDKISSNEILTIYSSPTLISPTENQILTDREVIFNWSKNNIAKNYELILNFNNKTEKYYTKDTTFKFNFKYDVTNFEWSVISIDSLDNSSGRSINPNNRFNTFKTTGIIENTINSNITIYPNPASDVLNVDFSNIYNSQSQNNLFNNSNSFEYSILDISGKLITKKFVDINSNIMSINVNSLANGVYILQIKSQENNSKNENGKLIYKFKIDR